MAMRIGFVLSTSLGNRARYDILRKYVERDPRVVPVWAPVKHYYATNERDPVRWLPRPLHQRAVVVAQAWPVLKTLRSLDAVVVHQLEVQPIVLAASGLGRKPVVFAAQDNPPMIIEAGYPAAYLDYASKSNMRRRVRKQLDVRIAQATPFHLTFSRWQEHVLSNACGISPQRVAVAHCGLDLEHWSAMPPAQKNGLPRILFVAGDFERKGGSFLLNAFRERLCSRAALDIVTNDPVVDDQSGVTVHRGLTTGDARLRAIFAGATLLVLPTKADFSPWVCLEAMACNLPVVAMQVGGIGDMVLHGITGLTVAPNDLDGFVEAVETLLADRDYADELGRQGRRHVERNFNAAINVPATIDLIENALRCGQFG